MIEIVQLSIDKSSRKIKIKLFSPSRLTSEWCQNSKLGKFKFLENMLIVWRKTGDEKRWKIENVYIIISRWSSENINKSSPTTSTYPIFDEGSRPPSFMFLLTFMPSERSEFKIKKKSPENLFCSILRRHRLSLKSRNYNLWRFTLAKFFCWFYHQQQTHDEKAKYQKIWKFE